MSPPSRSTAATRETVRGAVRAMRGVNHLARGGFPFVIFYSSIDLVMGKWPCDVTPETRIYKGHIGKSGWHWRASEPGALWERSFLTHLRLPLTLTLSRKGRG